MRIVLPRDGSCALMMLVRNVWIAGKLSLLLLTLEMVFSLFTSFFAVLGGGMFFDMVSLNSQPWSLFVSDGR